MLSRGKRVRRACAASVCAPLAVPVAQGNHVNFASTSAYSEGSRSPDVPDWLGLTVGRPSLSSRSAPVLLG